MPFDTSSSDFLLDYVRFWGQGRSLENLHRLKNYEYTIKNKLSEQDQLEVQKNLEAYANPNKIRWLRSKARFKAMCLALPSSYGALLALQHFQLLKVAKMQHIIGAFVGMTLFYYPLMRVYVGWTSREHYMNEYAVIVKRLRNAQIRN